IALEATKNKISTSVWGAPIQVGNFYKNLRDILSTDLRPQIFFRMGYSDKKFHHSPRLKIKDVLID
ncbi:MAG: hypothetical protein Q8Q89_02450, partial [bacterium]|nr:hypothetical protein [bacterium]